MSARRAADVVDELGRLLLGAPLPFSVDCWDGSGATVDGAPTLVVRNRRALRRLVWAPGELGLARAYVSGDLDVEGDLYAALSFPDELPARPDLRLGPRALARLGKPLLRLGALGPPPAPPREEARLRGLRHSLRRDREAVSHHYDVGNDFYRLLLGPSLVYSCAYFAEPAAGLEEAQEAKLEMVCRKIGLQEDMRLLDVGCGWGSLALHAAARYGVSVTAVTISAAQADLARRRVADAGLAERVEVRLQDYREVADGPYDAISSIGMAEHVGLSQLPVYAARLHALLRPGGRLLNQAIARGPAAGPDRPDPRSFLTRYVFPDGELQPLATHVRVLEEAGLEVCDVEALRPHYALTCRAWVRNLERRWEDAVALSSPGRARVWRLYLAGSALAFERHRAGVNQVLAVKPAARGQEARPLRGRTRAAHGSRSPGATDRAELMPTSCPSRGRPGAALFAVGAGRNGLSHSWFRLLSQLQSWQQGAERPIHDRAETDISAARTDVVQWACHHTVDGGPVSIDLDIVGRRYGGPISWSSSQALLYALGVGAGGSDAHDELAFTTENSHGILQQVLPTFAVVLGTHGAEGEPVSPVQGAPEIPLAKLLHGEQTLTLHGALPATGAATFTGRISAVYDTGRHALIENVGVLRDTTTGDVLAETGSSMIVRGEGGFGGNPAPTAPWALPERPADVTRSYPTRRDQALLYRLSGDRNPLHSDPWFARSAGLERPILHGLCTYGFAGRALLHEVCGGDPARFGSMSARFTRMVAPGDTLDVDIWRTTAGALFRASVDDHVVLDRGTFRLRAI